MKKTTVSPQKKAARSQKKAARAARSPKGQGERWSFSLGETEWGPFKTKGAKIDSRSLKAARTTGMVGLGNYAVDIQRKMPRLSSSINENGNVVDILEGTDFIAPVTSATGGNNAGDLLFTQQISPSKFLQTRLRQFADLYQRYRFRRIHFLYEPIANATQSGQVLGFADFDVDNLITDNSSENLNIAAAHQGEAITQIWEPMLFDMGQVFSFTDLYTESGASASSDPRLSIQGVFYLIAASLLAPNLPLGNIYVDYEIEFSIPFLSAQSLVNRQSHGWYGLTVTNGLHGTQVTLGEIDRRSERGPVIGVETATNGGHTFAWANCRPGDQIYFSVSFADVATGTITSLDSSIPLTFTNGSGNLLLTRQVYRVGAPSTGFWVIAGRIDVLATVGSGLVTIDWDVVDASGADVTGTTLQLGWVLEPAAVASRGVRRQAFEKDHVRLHQVEQRLMALMAKLEESSSKSERTEPTKADPRVSKDCASDLEFTHVGTREEPHPSSRQVLSPMNSGEGRVGTPFASPGASWR